MSGDAGPFAALGLPARTDLTDDDVRAAWRRIAAATHPDRADGGDPSRFAVAAAAYTVLRTRSGRGEALADLAVPSAAPRLPRPGRPSPGRPSPGSPSPGRPSPGRPSPGSPSPGSRSPGRPSPGAPFPRAPSPGAPQPGGSRAGPRAGRTSWAAGRLVPERARSGAARLASRIRRGRPARLALRVLIAAALSALVVAVARSQPATPALITGVLTWLLLTAPHDLAPPP